MAPLVRHPEKGGEISKRCFRRWWKKALVRAGLEKLATGGHVFGIRGCTAMTEFARLDAAVESIGWTNKRMGERYAHMADKQRT